VRFSEQDYTRIEMPRTRRQLTDREKLEQAKIEELRREADSYGLSPGGDRLTLIDRILSHLERHGPTDSDHEGADGVATGGQESTTLLTAEVFLQTMMSMQQQMAAQQRQFLEEISAWRREAVRTTTAENNATAQAPPRTTMSPVNGSSEGGNGNSNNLGATKWLAAQISEFGGTEAENIGAWTRRVDKIAEVHGAADNVILLAASSRLVKDARRWYDLQEGLCIESWQSLKSELMKTFERRLPFYKVIQRVETRKWIVQKETFDQFALAKLALMQGLDLPERDKIHLIIGGITSGSLRATALALASETIEDFLDKMRGIAESCSETTKNVGQSAGNSKPTSKPCRNCGGANHHHKDCKKELTCFLCKGKGHRRFDCVCVKLAYHFVETH